ncbi:hypothetical protein LTR78_003575 [Recurvomyces mirabilis]|uniref:Uncharacterized protein n=1 Tax=Recurvomyces mirabilis TaxID=574656 RepID=A0AAE0WS33_9PEZI|nr:hypothetical protein LTR78_003575 [Recurvomyces mirabilis]
MAYSSLPSHDPGQSIPETEGAIALNDGQDDSLLAHQEDPVVAFSANKAANTAIRSSGVSSPCAGKFEEATEFPSRRLQHFPLVVYLSLAYAAVAVFAWCITCVLVYRPINTGHYGLWLRDGDVSGAYYPSTKTYATNEQWLRAARVLQAIVAIITIPLTSTVCASAAVAFVQRSCKSRNLTLRQTTVLADNGWTAIEVYEQLIRGRWKQYGSKLLYLAIVLHLLGAIVTPLQSIFTNTLTVQTPGDLRQIQKLTDFTDRLRGDNNDDIAAATLRAAMISTSSTDPQNRLWSASGVTNCTTQTPATSSACAFGQISLSNTYALNDPFMAQLPAGYNTGLVRQFLPRLNSSVTRERITEADFPMNCSYQSTFFANYSTTVLTGWYNGSRVGPSWHLIACMPGTDEQSRPVSRARQDFSEHLYLNLSAYNGPNSDNDTPDDWSGLFRVTLRTTSGYFELPNHMNANLPGPIFNHNSTTKSIRPGHERRNTVESNGTTVIPTAAYNVNNIQNKGPLLTIALALFGPGSFAADRVTHPANYINVAQEEFAAVCIDRAPFVSLLSTPSMVYEATSTRNSISCIPSGYWNFGQLQDALLEYVQTFIGPRATTGYTSPNQPPYDKLLANAFEAAAFLANEQWLTSAKQTTLTVSYDAGIPRQALHISEAAIILISILLGIYLAALLGVAFYSNRDPRWTNRLDSLVMMQYGAAIADTLPMNVVADRGGLAILDEAPGWVGDVNDIGQASVGMLGLGGTTPLRARKRYMCFEHDHEGEAVQKKRNDSEKERVLDFRLR